MSVGVVAGQSRRGRHSFNTANIAFHHPELKRHKALAYLPKTTPAFGSDGKSVGCHTFCGDGGAAAARAWGGRGRGGGVWFFVFSSAFLTIIAPPLLLLHTQRCQQLQLLSGWSGGFPRPCKRLPSRENPENWVTATSLRCVAGAVACAGGHPTNRTRHQTA